MMNKNKENNTLVPELRFGEFEGEWEENILGAIADFSKGKGVAKKDIASDGKLFCIRYGELYTNYNEVIDEVISKTNLHKDNLILSKGNEVIIPSSGETQFDIARASCVLGEGIALGGDLNIIQSRINGVFLSYYINGSKKKAIAQLAQGVSVMHLYNSQLKKLEIEIPKPEEQQKIAHTLTSLDELIAAEQEKRDALTAHKEGLLQQLFPAQGEKVPKLRFSEFRGEWEEKRIGDEDVSEIVMGSSPKSSFYNKDKAGLPLLQGNADIKNRLSCPRIFTTQVTKECQINDILLSVRAPVGTVAKSIHHACIGRGIASIRANKNNIQEFLYQWLISFEPYWINISQGGTFDAVKSDDIRKLTILIPKSGEQQKIAHCLSSLDEWIAAQSEKIDALKEHKNGLMQGLFPV